MLAPEPAAPRARANPEGAGRSIGIGEANPDMRPGNGGPCHHADRLILQNWRTGVVISVGVPPLGGNAG